MEIKENISLKPLNTFGIAVKAKYYVEITRLTALKEVLKLPSYPNPFIISGGSNMLLTKDIESLAIHLNLKGIHIQAENEDMVMLKVMAGENWHELVLWTLNRGYGGLENLSLIPGKMGTAPMQNIGAYGVELKDVFVECEAMHIQNQETIVFNKEDCKFGYRDSIFKNDIKGKYIITSVTLRLTKKNHALHTAYGAIEDELKANNIDHPTIRDISNAVISIRRKKLPDPKEIGNCGSFFKNPIISRNQFKQFQEDHPNAPFYQMEDGNYKIPAGWLIEQSGFKGKRFGHAGVHKNQALVLVNHGNATGQEILQLAEKIQETILMGFGITLSPEVNIIK